MTDELASDGPELPILYRDDELIAVHKPSALPVHRGWAQESVTLLSLARRLVDGRLYLPHRLDAATSGVQLIATSQESVRALSQIFASRAVEKRYLALVRGVAEEATIIDYSLRKSQERGPHVPRQRAVTVVRRLGVFERYSLVLARPLTGRLHQIRRHLKHRSLHIIGDTRYGKGEHNRIFRTRFDLHRLALHAGRLDLTLPHTDTSLRPNTSLRLVCLPDDSFAQALRQMDLWEAAVSALEDDAPDPLMDTARLALATEPEQVTGLVASAVETQEKPSS